MQSTDSEKTSQATWGKLACEILRTDWEAAMEEVTKVKDLIEQKVVPCLSARDYPC
jgi:translation initiation factor 3 subunit E